MDSQELQLASALQRVNDPQRGAESHCDPGAGLISAMPQPCLLTGPDSTILEANRAAGQLLNVSQRFLIGKALSVFVCEDRTRFLADTMRAAAVGTPVDMQLKLRPRERAPMTVSVRVVGGADGLRWVLRTVADRGASL